MPSLVATVTKESTQSSNELSLKKSYRLNSQKSIIMLYDSLFIYRCFFKERWISCSLFARVGVFLDPKVHRQTLDHLYTDEKLNRGESLISKNGQYEFTLKQDGDLVLLQLQQNVY